MSKLVLALGAAVLLSSCVSAPPTSDEIHAKVVELIGEPMTPDAPALTIMTEPTEVRWTIFRPADGTTITTSDGKPRDAADPVRDNLLGIHFGHGLFLDTAGNLSILPFQTWPNVWKVGEEYSAEITPTIWAKNTRKSRMVQILPDGLRVSQKGTFGPSQRDYPTLAESVVAFNKRAALKAQLWWETNAVQLLEAVHTLGYTKSGIEYTLHHLTKDTTQFQNVSGGVIASNKQFQVLVQQDHWNVKIPSHEWWIYFGRDTMAVVDVRTGDLSHLTVSEQGARLSSSRGNDLSVTIRTEVPKP